MNESPARESRDRASRESEAPHPDVPATGRVDPGSDARDPDVPGTEGVDPASADLDRLPTLGILELMNTADETVPGAVRQALPALAEAIDAIVERLGGGGRLVYAGAGTSGRLAMLDAVESVPTFGVRAGLVSALVAGGHEALFGSVEGAEDDADQGRADAAAAGVGEQDALVGLAASGRTPYVLGALEEARARGALTVAISNSRPAPILDLADHGIALPTGPEVLAGSTRLKAGTAQKLVLNMISTAAMVRLGRVHGNRMIDVAVTNRKLRARAEGIVADLVGCDRRRAAALLEAAELEVKTASLMGLLSLDATAARQRLAAAGGVLRRALEGEGAGPAGAGPAGAGLAHGGAAALPGRDARVPGSGSSDRRERR